MCLVAIAHRVSEDVPLVIAANRDEDYQRPTLAAARWGDAPDVAGGRDAEAGGSWLAIRTTGRWAAVTNLRGATRARRSRGALVRDFVTSSIDAPHYADSVLAEAGHYGGFHLLTGDEAGTVTYVTAGLLRELPPGIHAFSNAPAGEHWTKVSIAVEAMVKAMSEVRPDAIVESLLSFLSTSRGAGAVQDEVFIAGDRYGTRSSTVIVATAGQIVVAEQSWGPGGVRLGDRRTLRLPLH